MQLYLEVPCIQHVSSVEVKTVPYQPEATTDVESVHPGAGNIG